MTPASASALGPWAHMWNQSSALAAAFLTASSASAASAAASASAASATIFASAASAAASASPKAPLDSLPVLVSYLTAAANANASGQSNNVACAFGALLGRTDGWKRDARGIWKRTCVWHGGETDLLNLSQQQQQPQALPAYCACMTARQLCSFVDLLSEVRRRGATIVSYNGTPSDFQVLFHRVREVSVAHGDVVVALASAHVDIQLVTASLKGYVMKLCAVVKAMQLACGSDVASTDALDLSSPLALPKETVGAETFEDDCMPPSPSKMLKDEKSSALAPEWWNSGQRAWQERVLALVAQDAVATAELYYALVIKQQDLRWINGRSGVSVLKSLCKASSATPFGLFSGAPSTTSGSTLKAPSGASSPYTITGTSSNEQESFQLPTALDCACMPSPSTPFEVAEPLRHTTLSAWLRVEAAKLGLCAPPPAPAHCVPFAPNASAVYVR